MKMRHLNNKKDFSIYIMWIFLVALTFAHTACSSSDDDEKWPEEPTGKYWLVAWNLNGGTWPSDDNHVTQVLKDGTLAEPNAPQKAGCTFGGWYKESALSNKVSFPYNVSDHTAHFTLHAKWTAKETENPGKLAIYVAGEEGGSTGVVKVWKNGVELHALTKGTGYVNVYSMFVDGNDVYVAGDEENASKKYVAKVWKNGSEYFTFGNGTHDSYAKSVWVSGGNVYIAGYEYTSPSKTAKIWKNKEVLYNLTVNDNDPSISTMLMSGNDIYVCGKAKVSPYSHYKATVWKNGNQLFTFGPTSASGNTWSDSYDMRISGNSIYVSGYTGNSVSAIIYQYNGGASNGTLYTYPATQRVNPYAYAYTMDMMGQDACVVVTSGTDKVYKNNSELYSFATAKIKDILVKEGDVYLTGSDDNKGKVWKNGEELYTLTDGSKYATGSAIFLVNE